ncbi:isoleucine--tRNA ligase, cytoplasmic-like [Hydractinia symbiolongicarpus]|uniref:isoleucine--tRNA ligase, cytoplasmic-like n=1 Tax=Hydractinia symbiolongicarpus TaxID=13093 RepID=UPI00254D31F6|nr:isoleucine--tRNA ligase, cytoplasmic-like [Hydractinia symbiolongicarpus]
MRSAAKRLHEGKRLCPIIQRNLAISVCSLQKEMAKSVGESYNFPKEEEKIIELWKKIDAFQTSLKLSEGRPRFSFYDGPPFATGLPHYGHILAGTIKDVVTRYAHQSGFHVERRFGWDCHGLPVEYEIDQKLGIKGPDDVAKIGIAAYNKECRAIVSRYAKEWEIIVGRIGRWIDFEHDYKTMYPSFMESVWWVFKQLHEKDMVYRGFRVMPYSTKCNTPLSNFEANLNYKDVVDPAVIVSFPLDESPNVSMIAWTTTPWTLPSNLALVVNPELTYVKVKDNSSEKVYIMMEARLSALFKTEDQYTVLEKFAGKTLAGKTYKPLFPYFEKMKSSNNAFRVLTDGYVTDDSGTGIVHSAPAFGEDDYRVCLGNGILERGGKLPCPVNSSGHFTDEVFDFKDMHVKDADKLISKKIKEGGRMVHQGTIKHSYPFCWRSDTPLIYKAVPGWFIRVENMVPDLLKNNENCYWVPSFVKEKRFHNWLENARDWNVSRNRYWGTPIPLWVSDDFEEVVCVGSVEELHKLSGVKVDDLHKEFVDNITIPSQKGKGTLKRVTEVFDCWFESGSMPYAQNHYPFENKEVFEQTFPADFIAEGVDQTRGWFYTLLVLSTALFNKPPYKNLIVNGLVLAKDGEKMSKRKKNYPDPMSVINKYGSDALRLYLINSPVVRADTLKFREEGVRDVIKDVFLPWYNAYRFLVQNIDVQEKEHGSKFKFNMAEVKSSGNIMDKWIESFTQSLLVFIKQEMAAYRLYTVVPRLMKFVDNLTNWYVRFNRKRLKGDTGAEDGGHALNTLFNVVFTMVKVMAPYTPFLTEHMYQNLKNYIVDEGLSEVEKGSVHFMMLPQPREDLIYVDVETAVSRMQTVIELGRVARDRKKLSLKYPLPELVILHNDEKYMEDVLSLEKYILEELNVKTVTTSKNKEKYGLKLKADLDFRSVGRRLKQDFKKVQDAIKSVPEGDLKAFQHTGKLTVAGHELTEEDVTVNYAFGDNPVLSEKYEAHSDGEVVILLNTTPDKSMLDEGYARELINRMQKLRKKAKLVPTEEITIVYEVLEGKDSEEYKKLCEVSKSHADFIVESVKQPVVVAPGPQGLEEIIQETVECKRAELRLTILRGRASESNQNTPQPFCRFINLELKNIKPCLGVKGCRGSLLLENPKGDFLLSKNELNRQVAIIFGLQGQSFVVSDKDDLSTELEEPLTKYCGKLLYVGKRT